MHFEVFRQLPFQKDCCNVAILRWTYGSRVRTNQPMQVKIMPSMPTAAASDTKKGNTQPKQIVPSLQDPQMDDIKSILEIQPVSAMKARRHSNCSMQSSSPRVRGSPRARSVFADLRHSASNAQWDVTSASAASKKLSLLNERSYNVFLQFTDHHFDHHAYTLFKLSDNSYWMNITVFVALLSFCATCADTYGIRGQPWFAAAFAAACVCILSLVVSVASKLVLEVSAGVDGVSRHLRQTCRVLYNNFGRYNRGYPSFKMLSGFLTQLLQFFSPTARSTTWWCSSGRPPPASCCSGWPWTRVPSPRTSWSLPWCMSSSPRSPPRRCETCSFLTPYSCCTHTTPHTPHKQHTTRAGGLCARRAHPRHSHGLAAEHRGHQRRAGRRTRHGALLVGQRQLRVLAGRLVRKRAQDVAALRQGASQSYEH